MKLKAKDPRVEMPPLDESVLIKVRNRLEPMYVARLLPWGSDFMWVVDTPHGSAEADTTDVVWWAPLPEIEVPA